MKNLCLFATALVASGLLSACAKSNSVDGEGNCTGSYVSAYNSVLIQKGSVRSKIDSSIYSVSEKRDAVMALSNACETFYNNHSDITCKAELSGTETTVHSADHRSACDAASKYLRDTENMCTTQFVSSYNEVLRKSEKFKTTVNSPYYSPAEKKSAAWDLKSACVYLLNIPARTSCQAETNGVTKTVSATDLKPACDSADQYLKSIGALNTTDDGSRISPVTTSSIN
jgi:hypothetical protein